jgi:hypothetical protein
MTNNSFEKSEKVHPMIRIAIKIPCNQGQRTVKQQLKNDIYIILQLNVHVLNDCGEKGDDFRFPHLGDVLRVVGQQGDEVRQEQVRGGRRRVRYEGLA